MNKSKKIVQLKPRNPDYRSSKPIILRALCDYKQDQVCPAAALCLESPGIAWAEAGALSPARDHLAICSTLHWPYKFMDLKISLQHINGFKC